MPIVSIFCNTVNPHLAQDIYYKAIALLKPKEVPCIYCQHPVTYSHGSYPRKPYTFGRVRLYWEIHRRKCPGRSCGRTFGLLPDLLAPYARYEITIQDLTVSHLASGKTYRQTADYLEECGVSPSELSMRRWYKLAQVQVEQILPKLSSLVQSKVPELRLPPFRSQVRSSALCFYYDLLNCWGGVHSGSWNILRLIACMFAPSESADRVSYGLAPG
jgi:hypothetical protein